MGLCCLNVEGLSREKLTYDLKELFEKHDILGFVETWTNPEKKDALGMRGWDLYTKFNQRPRNRGRFPGGVAVYVKQSLQNMIDEIETHMENVIILCYEYSYTKIAVFFLYNPPPASAYCSPSFFDELESEVLKLQDDGYEVLILGDLNARVGEAEDVVDATPYIDSIEYEYATNVDEESWATIIPKRNNMDKVINPNGLKLTDALRTVGACILNGRCTPDLEGEYTFLSYNGSSTIDLGICSLPLYHMVKSFEVLDNSGLSKHSPISLQMSLPCATDSQPKEMQTRLVNGMTVKRYTWSQEKARYFLRRFQNFFGGIFLLCSLSLIAGKTEEAVKKLTSFMQMCATSMLPTHRKTHNNQANSDRPKWWTHSCTHTKARYMAAQRKMRHKRNEKTTAEYNRAKRLYRATRREAQTLFQNEKREHIMNLKNEHDTRSFWKCIKKYVKPNTNVANNIHANDWIVHYKEQLSPGDPLARPEWEVEEYTEDEPNIEIMDDPFTSEEVLLSIKSLRNGKAPGVEGIAAEFYKNTGQWLAALLAAIFQKIYDLGTYPADWATALIYPIYKKRQQQ